MEVSMIYMRYITYSDEHPLGKVERIWWRHEYQDTMGNLSHIHSLIWLKDEPLSTMQDRIRGSVASLLEPDEMDALIKEGLLANEGEIASVLDDAARILKHKCSERCKKRKSVDGQLICRADDNAKMNPTPTRHSVVPVFIKHSDQAENVLQQMDLFQFNPLVVCQRLFIRFSSRRSIFLQREVAKVLFRHATVVCFQRTDQVIT
jgi:hypothetical protein